MFNASISLRLMMIDKYTLLLYVGVQYFVAMETGVWGNERTKKDELRRN